MASVTASIVFSHSDQDVVETSVRITAQRHENGRVEFALQQRNEGGAWGDRLLPRSRFFPASGSVGRWLNSTPVVLDVEIPAELLVHVEEASTEPEEPEASEEIEVVEGATRETPIPFGQVAQVGDWEIRVLDTNPDAWEVIQAVNQFNDPPEVGWNFFMVALEVRYLGPGSSSETRPLSLGLLGSSNVVRYSSALGGCGVIPGGGLWREVFSGGKSTGNHCAVLTSQEAAGDLVLIVDSRTSPKQRVFMALDAD